MLSAWSYYCHFCLIQLYINEKHSSVDTALEKQNFEEQMFKDDDE